jgi:bleomycin hydrolase
MGANQSKASLLNQKLVVERLRALKLEEGAKNDSDYIYVDEKHIPSCHSFKKHRDPWKNLSISEVEHWEHELLQDPKNRYPSRPANHLIAS